MYWPPRVAALIAAHVLANLVWIGALLAEAVLMTRVQLRADPEEVGALARRVHTRLAIPAFLGSVAAGLARFVPDVHAYAKMPWMHAKLAFAVAVIVLHHMMGARARRLANGRDRTASGAWVLGWLVLASAAGAVLFAVAKSTP